MMTTESKTQKHSELDGLLVSGPEKTTEFVTDLLRWSSHEVVSCTPQQVAILHRMLAAAFSMQHDGSSSSPSSGSQEMCTRTAAPLIFASHPYHHRKKPLKKSSVLIKAVDYGLHFKKSGRMLAEEKKMSIYKQFGFVSLVFLGNKSVITDVRGSESSERIAVPRWHSAKRQAARRLPLEQKIFSASRAVISVQKAERPYRGSFCSHFVSSSGVLHGAPPWGVRGV